MKYFICTQLFHSEETKKSYFGDNKDITSREWLASVEGDKVKCIQHRFEDQEILVLSLDRWKWKSNSQKIEAIGADKLFLTMPQEMKVYATAEEPDIRLSSVTSNTIIS